MILGQEKCLTGCGQQQLAYASFGAVSTPLTGKTRAILWTGVTVAAGMSIGAILVSSKRSRSKSAGYGALIGLTLGVLPAIALWKTE